MSAGKARPVEARGFSSANKTAKKEAFRPWALRSPKEKTNSVMERFSVSP